MIWMKLVGVTIVTLAASGWLQSGFKCAAATMDLAFSFAANVPGKHHDTNAAVSRKAVANAWAKPAQGNR